MPYNFTGSQKPGYTPLFIGVHFAGRKNKKSRETIERPI